MLRILSDSPATVDLLDYKRYVLPITSLISDAGTATPITIGIFGSWGTGKSTLLGLIDQALPQDEFLRVRFNPWVHRSEPSMLIPLLHCLHDSMEGDAHGRFIESAKKIGTVLLRLGTDVLLRGLTADATSLEHIEKLEQQYLNQRGKVTSEIRRLRQTIAAELERIKSNGVRVVLFVDDLDRCDPLEIIDVLESVKLFLDVPNLVTILALDHDVVSAGISMRYDRFRFGSDRLAVIGSEYMQKMVQLPVYLQCLSEEGVHQFIEALGLPSVLTGQSAELARWLEPNPRRVKRVMNGLELNLDIIQDDTTKGLGVDTIARLIVLQYQCPVLYGAFKADPNLLVTVERVCQTGRDLSDDASFSDLGERSEEVLMLCRKYILPREWLSRLFSRSTFENEIDLVVNCLAKFG